MRPDSPADVAGLQPYDILRSINGVPLRSDDTVIRLFYEARVGTRLEFSAEREGQDFTGVMILAEAPRRQGLD